MTTAMTTATTATTETTTTIAETTAAETTAAMMTDATAGAENHGPRLPHHTSVAELSSAVHPFSGAGSWVCRTAITQARQIGGIGTLHPKEMSR